MRAGKPKLAADTPPKRGRPKSQASDAGALPKPKLDASNNRALLTAILRDERLTAEDRDTIQQAAREGINLADLAAMVSYELTLARRLYAEAALDAKDLMVALNKIASQVAAAAQLGVGQESGGSTRIEVVVRGGGEAVPVGDMVDVEG
jgi:hypothetical protein